MKNFGYLLGLVLFCMTLSFGQNTSSNEFDVIIRGGTVYDGSGGKPYKADVGIKGDLVTKIGYLSKAKSDLTVDATGRAVAPAASTIADRLLPWVEANCEINCRILQT